MSFINLIPIRKMPFHLLDKRILMQMILNEKGVQYGTGTILEWKDGWIRISLPMQESDFWFKSDSSSYEFKTSIIVFEHESCINVWFIIHQDMIFRDCMKHK